MTGIRRDSGGAGADGEALAGILVTPGGLERLRAELRVLHSERAALLEALRTAWGGASRGVPDELDARAELARLEEQIARLKHRIDSASVVAPDPSDGALGLGESVQARELESGEVVEYRVVGAGEADPGAGSISYLSPFGAAVLGRSVGDVVKVVAPNGVRHFEIIEIDL